MRPFFRHLVDVLKVWACIWILIFLVMAGIRYSMPTMTSRGPGIFLQAHIANEPFPFLHLSIKVIPTDQAAWKRKHPEILQEIDALSGFTVGAGEKRGLLEAGLNRSRDLTKSKVFVSRLELPKGRTEDDEIEAILAVLRSYDGQARFSAVPLLGERGNSNSFIKSLLERCSLSCPEGFDSIRFWTVGFGSVVHEKHFYSQKMKF